jgi:hypothetical protein
MYPGYRVTLVALYPIPLIFLLNQYMDISPFINWAGLAEASGNSIEFLKKRVPVLVSLDPTPKITPIAPKQIQEMSLHERRLYFKTEGGKVLEVLPDPMWEPSFDRICVKDDGFVCFSSADVLVAKTVPTKTTEISPLVMDCFRTVSVLGETLNSDVFSRLPRRIDTFQSEQYRSIPILANGQPGQYPGLIDSPWQVDALHWRRWGRILGLHTFFSRWKVAVHCTGPESYWTLLNNKRMIVTKLVTSKDR